jgi:hypothetical protein
MATMYYDQGRGSCPAEGQKDRHHRLWQPGPCPRLEPEGQRLRCAGGPVPGEQVLGQGRGRGPQGQDGSRCRRRGGHRHDAGAGYVQPEIYKASMAPNLRAGKMLMFAHGFNIRYGQIVPPANVDVTMVAPKGPGHRVREIFPQGRRAGPVGRLSGCHRPGQAARAGLCAGIGCTRAGVIETTFAEETETDLFGEQAVLCGGLTRADEGRL